MLGGQWASKHAGAGFFPVTIYRPKETVNDRATQLEPCVRTYCSWYVTYYEYGDVGLCILLLLCQMCQPATHPCKASMVSSGQHNIAHGGQEMEASDKTSFLDCRACPLRLVVASWRKRHEAKPAGTTRWDTARSHLAWVVLDDACPPRCFEP